MTYFKRIQYEMQCSALASFVPLTIEWVPEIAFYRYQWPPYYREPFTGYPVRRGKTVIQGALVHFHDNFASVYVLGCDHIL